MPPSRCSAAARAEVPVLGSSGQAKRRFARFGQIAALAHASRVTHIMGRRGRTGVTDMTWTGKPLHDPSGGSLAAAQLAHSLESDRQNERAARVVASRALDAVDCAELLAMLGLNLPVQRRPKY